MKGLEPSMVMMLPGDELTVKVKGRSSIPLRKYRFAYNEH
jgi:hypothetical protein